MNTDVARAVAAMQAAIESSPPAGGAPASIRRVTMRDGAGAEMSEFVPHQPLTLEVVVEAAARVHGLVVGVQVRDMLDRLLWTTRTDWQGVELPALGPGQQATVLLGAERLLLGKGWYQVTVAIHQVPNDKAVFHWIDGVWTFSVGSAGTSEFGGMVDLGWACADVRLEATQPAVVA
jgi:hypothetical protein